MNQTRYVQILCRVCSGKTLVLGGQPRPMACALCKAPWDDAPEEEQDPPTGPRPTDPGVRAPATFPRGTFTNSSSSVRKSDSAAGRAPVTRKTSSASAPATGGLKDKLKRLFILAPDVGGYAVASIDKRIAVEVEPETAWQRLRDIGKAHELFAPVLTECRLEGDVRTVRFANGTVVHEQILDVDDEHRRVAYAALDGPGMTYHHASMRVDEAGPGTCRLVWTTDFLPAGIRDKIAPLIEQGAAAFKRNLEKT